MRSDHCRTALAVLVLAAAPEASILDLVTLEVDLTDPEEASEMASWSDPDLLAVTGEGLGWDGEPAAVRDGWLHTRPMALGLSWRAPAAVSVSVTILPGPGEVVLDNGQTMTPHEGDLYVRFSSDTENWSSWQVLQRGWNPSITAVTEAGRHYYGSIQVPLLERGAYQELLREFAEMDVPWKSDEEAACRWIAGEHPGFFAEHIPFIGYVEFLYEGSFHGGRRLTSFSAEVVYGMSGIHYPPDDESVYQERDSRPWSFTGIRD